MALKKSERYSSLWSSCDELRGGMDRISQALTQRVKELAQRYKTPIPQMVSRVAELEARVNRHLERMGFSS